MKRPTLYYETRSGLPAFGDIMHAIDGFESLGFNCEAFSMNESRSPIYADFPLQENDVVIGGVLAMRKHFQNRDCLPSSIDYPDSLGKNLTDRHIERMTLERVTNMYMSSDKLFIKPVVTKASYFDAKLYSHIEAIALLDHHEPSTEVYVSEAIEIKAEFRVFVHKNKIIDIRRYAGKYQCQLPPIFWVERLITEYKDSPISYTLDVAIQNHAGVTLIEVNDFWAIGAYGLEAVIYAEMLKDRYEQITLSSKI